jgi:hypothetical protein
LTFRLDQFSHAPVPEWAGGDKQLTFDAVLAAFSDKAEDKG